MSGTTLTLKTEYSTTSIHVEDGDLSITELIDQVIEPVLLANGYSQETLDLVFWAAKT